MNKKDLDALAGLYESLYSPVESGEYLTEEEYLSEAPMTAFQAAGGQAKLDQLNKGRSPRSGRFTARDIERQGQENLFKAGGGNAAIAKGPTTTRNVRGGGSVKVPTLTRQDIINRGTVAARPGTPAAKPPAGTPAAKPPAGTPAAKPPAGTPAAKPPTSGSGAPAANRPAAPGPGSKVAPSSTAAPASAKPAASPMDQWRAANKGLAAASDERARIRGTQQTNNPLMKDFKSRLPMNSPSVQSADVSKLGKGNQSLVNNPNAFKAATPKATPTPASSAGTTPPKVSPASTPAAKTAPSPVMQKRPSGPGTGAMTRGGASGDLGPSSRTIRSSYEWGSKATLKDVASLYSSIYEGKKKDQDGDNDKDFADVMIARMMASGMSRAEAIAAVRNKEYNEEFVVDEGKLPLDKRRRERIGRQIGRRTYSSSPKKYDEMDKMSGALKAAQKKQNNEEFEIYEIVALYLLENNFAETLNDANVIIENMSETWLESILLEAPGEWFGGLRDKARASRAAQIQSMQSKPKAGPSVSSPFAKPASRNDSGRLTTYGAGGGAEAERRGQTRAQVMQQGAKNLETRNKTNPGPNFGR